MILKNRDTADCHALYNLMIDPAVFPFVRQKPASYDEFIFLTKQTIEAEERGELISRTIIDEWGSPIGTINLFDMNNLSGFLGTWIGKPYFGKGYNKYAKEAFLDELFFEKNIQTVYMKIRKENMRSYQAAMKLPYCSLAYNFPKDGFYEDIQANDYNFFQITNDQYHLHKKRFAYSQTHTNEIKEA